MEAAIDAGAAASANETVVSDAAPVTETTVTSAAPEPEKVVSIDDTLDRAYEKLNQPRDPVTKRFVPKNAGETETEAEQPADAEAPADEIKADQPEEGVVEQPKAAIDAPLSWPAEMKAKFGALPPDVQTYVAQRDKETHDAITRIGQDKKALEERVRTYEPFDQLVQHYAPDFQRRGIAPAQAFAVLLDAQSKLDANPAAALIQIGRNYGIDLAPAFQDLAQAQSLGVTPPGPNPEVMALRNELSQIKSHLTQQERQRFEAASAAEQSERTALQSQIAEFSKDKPHFAAVREIMGKLVLTGEAETLDQAYDKATWAHPEIRQRILADQRKADEDKRREEAAKKTADARKSAAVNVKSGTGSKNNPKSWTETVESEATRLFGT